VAERLGHTSVRMVDAVYVRLCEETSRELADAIDMLVERASRVRDGTTTGRGEPRNAFALVVPTGFEPVSPP
jgi:hypothetical protein